MPIVRVADPLDQRLDDYRNLTDAELARARGIFIAEGRLVVPRLLASRRFSTRSVLVTEPALAALPELESRTPDTPVIVVAQPLMNLVAGFNIHRGCLAAGVRRPPEQAEDVVTGASCVVVLERVANADNVGSIFRSGAAFGVEAVLLDDVTTDPLYRKAIRTSMGASLEIPFARVLQMGAALTELRNRGFAVIAMTPSDRAEPLDTVAARVGTRPVALVVGHEGDGLTSDALAQCDDHARIPMTGSVDSLNVATATAIALYEISRQRGADSRQ
jgi:tRNA G18 (ribose-2'-O)-methylase SpoU